MEVRYALISASINSLAMNIPRELLSEFVSRKTWMIDHALAYARRMPDLQQRVEALIEIASVVGEVEKAKIVREVVEMLQDEKKKKHWYRFEKVLWGIAGRVAELGFIEEALQMARTVTFGRASTLLEIIPWLPESMRVPVSLETLEALKAEDEKDKPDALNLSIKARELEELAEYLPEPLKSEVIIEGLAAARAIRRSDGEIEDFECEEYNYEEVERVTHMARFLPHLLGPLQMQVVGELLENARSINHKPSRARAMADSIPYLPEPIKSEVLQEALATARAIKNADDRAWQLSWLMEYLSEPLKGKVLKEALEASGSILEPGEAGERALAPAGLTKYFPERLALEWLESLIKINYAGAADYLLGELGGTLAGLGKIEEAARAVESIRDEKERQSALAELAPVLPDSLLLKISRTSPAINDNNAQAYAILGLAPYLPEEHMKLALLAMQSLSDSDDLGGYRSVKRLRNLIPHLPESLMDKAVALTCEIPELVMDGIGKVYFAYPDDDDDDVKTDPKINIFNVLVAQLVRYKQPEKALALARSFYSEDERVTALTKLFPHLKEPLKTEVLQESLALIQVIKSKPVRAVLQADIACLLPEPTRTEKLQEAVDIIRKMPGEYKCAPALARIAPYLTKEQLHQALAIAWPFEDARTDATVGLAPYLEEPKRSQVIREVIFEARFSASRALRELIPYLSEPVLLEMVPLVKKHEDFRYPSKSLIKLAMRLSEFGHVEEAFDIVRAIPDGYHGDEEKAHALAEMAPNLHASLLREALAIATTIKNGKNKSVACTALAGLAPYLSRDDAIESMQDMVKIAREQNLDQAREELWAKVVPALIALPPADLYPLWRETLHVLAQRTRGDILTDVYWLSSVITLLGGQEAAVETYRAIQDVRRWWS